MAKPLTDLAIRKASVTEGQSYLADGDGLYMRVRPTTKYWFLRYKQNWYGLGAYPEVSLLDARKLASDKRELLRKGIDKTAHAAILETRDDIASVKTFKDATLKWKEASDVERTNLDYRVQWLRQMERHVFPIIGSMPFAEITPQLVNACLKPISERSEVKGKKRVGGPFTARILQGRIAEVFDWLIANGKMPDNNPARWALISKLLPKLKHTKGKPHPAVRQEHVKPFIAALHEERVRGRGAHETAPDCVASQTAGRSALALEMLILTATRTQQVRFLPWSEIDLDNRLWTCPAKRTKMKTHDHDIPLSQRCIDILTELGGRQKQGSNELVFYGRTEGVPMAPSTMLLVNRRVNKDSIKQSPAPTDHGWRSTFRDWCGKTGVERELSEHALHHAFGSAAEQAYARDKLIERRRPVMERWAQFCEPEPPRLRLVEAA